MSTSWESLCRNVGNCRTANVCADRLHSLIGLRMLNTCVASELGDLSVFTHSLVQLLSLWYATLFLNNSWEVLPYSCFLCPLPPSHEDSASQESILSSLYNMRLWTELCLLFGGIYFFRFSFHFKVLFVLEIEFPWEDIEKLLNDVILTTFMDSFF